MAKINYPKLLAEEFAKEEPDHRLGLLLMSGYAHEATLKERERCAAIADSMRIKGAFPDTEESAQNWCAQYIAELIRKG